uniref:NACHT LRR and PYD domain-containing protein n=1 Tax=Hucho hucho TaxID=62062 RepID=A0A4W5QI00_9TELE
MCYIPLFCWILATVLEYILEEADCEDVPKTLTQMYIHFLQIQISMSNKKYNKATETNPKELSQSDKEMILKLGKLAFQQLERGNLIFYEKDLRESGIDISEASVFCEVCTEIFKEESWLCREKVFCFVHLSIQEFIAAVYKVHSCVDNDRNGSIHQMSDLHRSVISEALQSQNGHLDLFLQFFLGLSLEDNQALLGGLPSQPKNTSQTINETVKYIKEKIKEESSADRTLNLFHCLNELGDNSLVEEIQDSLRSGTLSDKELEPHQCSALAYVMLMSEERMDEFDLKSYNTSAAGQQRLIPVLKNVRSASLDKCHLNEECCETLASVLQSPDSDLRELDVSYNDMGDPGVLCLDAGLMSPHCKLEKLALAGCKLTDKSFEVVAFALMSGHSNLRAVDLSYNDVGDSGIQLICDGLVSPHCKLQKLRLAGCNISRESCERLASALPFADPQLKKLSLSYNNFGRSEMKTLCAAGQSCPLWKLQTLDFSFNDLEESGAWFLNGLLGQQCRLEKLALSGCNLTHESLETLASALQSPNSHLIELDLSYNNLGDSEFQFLGNGLKSPHCKLAKLGLAGCYLSYGCCETLVSAFMSQNACLRELDISYNNLGDCGVKLLCAGLTSPLCHIEILHLRECNITGVCCSDLATVLYSYNSKLKELELRDNNLQNSGLALLSAVLRDIHCEVQRLGLSGCRITEEGCIFLALALRSNPSHLKELDLSYNHPGDSGVKQLSAVLEDPHSMLKKLRNCLVVAASLCSAATGLVNIWTWVRSWTCCTQRKIQ